MGASPRALVLSFEFKMLPGPNRLVLAQAPVSGWWAWERVVLVEASEPEQEFQIFIFGSKCPPTTATTITAITTTIFFFTTVTIRLTTSKQHSAPKL